MVLRYVFSKVKWRFSIYTLTETWLFKNINNTIRDRHWMDVPLSNNIKDLTLPKIKLGLKITNTKEISTRKALTKSLNKKAIELYFCKKIKL